MLRVFVVSASTRLYTYSPIHPSFRISTFLTRSINNSQFSVVHYSSRHLHHALPPFSLLFCPYNSYYSMTLSRTYSLPFALDRSSNLAEKLTQPYKECVLSLGCSPVAVRLSLHSYCCGTAAVDHCITSAVDKLYRAVTDASSDSNHLNSMERALDQVGVELTTPLVVEVLQRLYFEEKLAFRFFTWAARQENYSHEPQVYNEMIDILSSTKYKVKQFRIICDLLDYMKRKDRKNVPVEVLVTILREYTEKHLTHLEKFAKKKKIRIKTATEVHALNLLLDALCKCSLIEDAEAMFSKIKNKVKPNANTYNILFFGWCRVRNPAKAMNTLEEMIKTGHTPDNFTYNTAIDTFCKTGMVKEASELLEFMKMNGSTMSSPTAKTYAIMIAALVQNDKMEECFKLLEDMINSGCLPDVSTYKELIEGMCLAGKVEAAYKLLEEMGNKGYPPDVVTYNCFLKVLCDQKNSVEALRLFGKMIEGDCKPSVHTFNMLITMFFEMGDPDGAFETWHEMDKRGCERNTDTYCLMVGGLFDCNNMEAASFLLEEIVNRGMKLPYQKFDSFLKQLSEIGDLQAIHRLSEHMRKYYNPAMARRFFIESKAKECKLKREVKIFVGMGKLVYLSFSLKDESECLICNAAICLLVEIILLNQPSKTDGVEYALSYESSSSSIMNPSQVKQF